MHPRIMQVQLFFFWGILALLISSFVARDRWYSRTIIPPLALCFYYFQLITTVFVLITILYALYIRNILRKAPPYKLRAPLTPEDPSLDDRTGGSTKVMISIIALTTLFVLGPAENRPTMTPAIVIVWATTVALASWDFTITVVTWVLIPLTGACLAWALG